MRAILYHRTSAADHGESVDVGLERLRRHALHEGWEVLHEVTDTSPRHDLVRPGWRQLCALAASPAGTPDLIACLALYRLFPSARDAVLQWGRWARSGVAIVALEDAVDTSRPEESLALRPVLAALERFEKDRHSESVTVGILRSELAGRGQALGGRRVVAVNHLEVAGLYHQGLSLRGIVREVRKRGGRMSYGLLRKHLQMLRDDGRLDEDRRSRAQEANPPSKGGRPRKKKKPERFPL